MVSGESVGSAWSKSAAVPGHNGRGHRRSRQGNIRFRPGSIIIVRIEQAGRRLRIERTARRGQADDDVARRDEIGFHYQINRAWPPAAVRADFVVRARLSSHRIHRAHRNDVRIIARTGDAAPLRGAVRIAGNAPPIVPCRADDGDARRPGPLTRLAERVGGVTLAYRMPHAQVENANVQAVFVRDAPVYTGDHPAHAARAVLIQHLHANDICGRGGTHHPRVVAELQGVRAVSGHQARDVGAMSVVIIGRGCPFTRSTHPRNALRGRCQIIVGIHARIYHGHIDALAAEMIVQERKVGPHRLRRIIIVERGAGNTGSAHHEIRGNVRGVRVGGKAGDGGGRQARGQCAVSVKSDQSGRLGARGLERRESGTAQ